MAESVVRRCAECGKDLSGIVEHKCLTPKEESKLSKIESKTVAAAGFNAAMPETEGDKDKKKKSKKTKT